MHVRQQLPHRKTLDRLLHADVGLPAMPERLHRRRATRNSAGHRPAHLFNHWSNKMKIGIAELGRMGSAIARRLPECGHEVTVWNRSKGKVDALLAAGATAAATPAALARSQRDRHHHPDRRRRNRGGLQRRARPAERRRPRQALHRDEHGATADGKGAGAEGDTERSGLRRMPGRRHGRPGAVRANCSGWWAARPRPCSARGRSSTSSAGARTMSVLSVPGPA